MQEYPQSSQRVLGELEAQQALNTQDLINGAAVVAMYLQPGQTLNDPSVDIDMILADLQAVVSGNY